MFKLPHISLGYLLYTKLKYADCCSCFWFSKIEVDLHFEKKFIRKKISLYRLYFIDARLSVSDVETHGRFDISTPDAFTFHTSHDVERACFFDQTILCVIGLCMERMLLGTWLGQYPRIT
jgi:hypothetical protein